MQSSHVGDASLDSQSKNVSPEINWAQPVPALTNKKDQQLEFVYTIDPRAALVSVLCQIDGSLPMDCKSSIFSLTGLADGDYSLKVVLKDSRNETAELSALIRIDTNPPI